MAPRPGLSLNALGDWKNQEMPTNAPSAQLKSAARVDRIQELLFQLLLGAIRRQLEEVEAGGG